MTQETAAKVKLTASNLEEARAKARRGKEELLARVAAEMPGKVDDLAKRYAHEQPNVTESLGREGVAALRAELAVEAESLGAQFVDAIDSIKWPAGHEVRGSSSIHSALFERFYRRTSGLAEILERHGYKVRQSTYTSISEVILPQSLYDMNSLGNLAPLLKDLSSAVKEHEAAVAADKRANVNDLWE